MAAGRKTGGRAKGTPNARTTELADMVLGALADAGGRKYLATQAIESPGAFMSLLGKFVPRDINLAGSLMVDVGEILRNRIARGKESVAQMEAKDGR